jgi:hypothetical protein
VKSASGFLAAVLVLSLVAWGLAYLSSPTGTAPDEAETTMIVGVVMVLVYAARRIAARARAAASRPTPPQDAERKDHAQ